MKSLIKKILTRYAFYALLAVCYSEASAQADTLSRDSINPMCQERGHISGGVFMQTLMYCQSYIIDTDSTTVQVYPACNSKSYTCKRCGKYVSEGEKERRVVIWRREE